MTRTAWLVLIVVVLGIALLATDVEAKKGKEGKRKGIAHRLGGGPSRRGPGRGRGPKPLLCKLTDEDGGVAWSRSCPEDAPCNKILPGEARFTVDGKAVTRTACDIEGYRPPRANRRAHPCLTRFLNGTEIRRSPCSDGAACNVSRGVFPERRSKEAAEVFVCDEEEKSGSPEKHGKPSGEKRNKRSKSNSESSESDSDSSQSSEETTDGPSEETTDGPSEETSDEPSEETTDGPSEDKSDISSEDTTAGPTVMQPGALRK